MSQLEPVLVAGGWRPAAVTSTYQAFDPTTAAVRNTVWPISWWADVEAALDAAAAAHAQLATRPVDDLARFLERYAQRL